MRTFIIITALLCGLAARGQTNLSGNLSNLVTIPWAVNPTNSTDYSRTNLPAWWDGGTNYGGWAGGTNYAHGVNTWMAWQAANHNLRLIAEYVTTNTVSGSTLFGLFTQFITGYSLPDPLTNSIDNLGMLGYVHTDYLTLGSGSLVGGYKIIFAQDGTLQTESGIIWTDTGLITAGPGGFNTQHGYINLSGTDGSANFANGGLTIGTAGELTASQYRFPTNAPPSGVTIGVTAPSFWAQVYDASGTAMGWTPVYTNH